MRENSIKTKIRSLGDIKRSSENSGRRLCPGAAKLFE
jgi:hypothetical protein